MTEQTQLPVDNLPVLQVFMLGGNTSKAEALKKKLLKYITSRQEEGKPFVLGPTAMYSIQLPDLSREDELVRIYLMKHLVDVRMLSELEEASVINFCPNVQKFYPLKTVGDGNCLLHAVSMAIWGLLDDSMLLRRLLYIRMVEDDNRAIYKRWKAERERLDQELPDGVQLSKQQWASEWDIAVKCAEDEKMVQKDVLPYESLEEIHIFVLANIIQRPIIVLSELVVRNLRGSVLGPNNFAGIYLPLLCEPTKCCKTPVILGYYMMHFTPLVNVKVSAESQARSSAKYVVPLVSKNLEPLYIHFLPQQKENKAYSVLQAYLNVCEINWTKSDGSCLLLAAQLNHIQIKEKYDLMNDFVTRVKDVFVVGKTQKQQPKEEVSEKTTYIISADRDTLYTGNKTKTVRKLIDKSRENVSKANCFIKIYGQNCIYPGCRREGTIECAGFCFECFLKKTAEKGKMTKNKLEQPFECQPSITNMRCQFHKPCMNLASTKTFPYCHDHADAEPASVKDYITFVANYQGCGFAASSKKSLHKDQGKNLQTLLPIYPTPKPDQHLQNLEEELDHKTIYLSMLPDKCAVTNCTYHASQATYPFCHEHFLNDESGRSRKDVTGQVFEEKPTEQLHSSSLPSVFERVDLQESAKKYSSLSDTEKPTSSKCLVPGCLLYGPPGSHGFCTQHQIQQTIMEPLSPTFGNNEAIHKTSDQRLACYNEESTEPTPATVQGNEEQALLEQPLSGVHSEQKCIGPLCQNKINRQKGHLCDVCYATLLKKSTAQQSHGREVEPCELELSKQPKLNVDKPSNSILDENKFHQLGTSESEGPQATGGLAKIEKKWKKSVKKCISVDCSNYGNPAKKGYCNQCSYKLMEQNIIL